MSPDAAEYLDRMPKKPTCVDETEAILEARVLAEIIYECRSIQSTAFPMAVRRLRDLFEDIMGKPIDHGDFDFDAEVEANRHDAGPLSRWALKASLATKGRSDR